MLELKSLFKRFNVDPYKDFFIDLILMIRVRLPIWRHRSSFCRFQVLWRVFLGFHNASYSDIYIIPLCQCVQRDILTIQIVTMPFYSVFFIWIYILYKSLLSNLISFEVAYTVQRPYAKYRKTQKLISFWLNHPSLLHMKSHSHSIKHRV